MILAASFQDAVDVAAPNCQEWIFLGNGQIYTVPELQEIATEYDDKTPLGDENILVVTKDGSIGLLYPYCKEPDWYFVSPEFAVVNILKDNPEKYMVPVDDGAQAKGGTGTVMGNSGGSAASNGTPGTEAVFCKNCGTRLDPDNLFCGNCGARNAPAFCGNCGAKLNPDDIFCANCGSKV
jgi:RNA polymerase subunit RPABC4/transcription elongation factor Spt4